MNKIETRLANIKDAPIMALIGRITFSETFGHYIDIKKTWWIILIAKNRIIKWEDERM